MDIENFYYEEDSSIVFKECWFDRCIDRNGEYIPFFPYWNNLYTSEDWIKEGSEIVKKKSDELIGWFKSESAKRGLDIVFSKLDEDLNLIPNKETGWDIYSKNRFLSINHKEANYEGYVFYGVTKIKFSSKNQKETILILIQDFLNR